MQILKITSLRMPINSQRNSYIVHSSFNIQSIVNTTHQPAIMSPPYKIECSICGKEMWNKHLKRHQKIHETDAQHQLDKNKSQLDAVMEDWHQILEAPPQIINKAIKEKKRERVLQDNLFFNLCQVVAVKWIFCCDDIIPGRSIGYWYDEEGGLGKSWLCEILSLLSDQIAIVHGCNVRGFSTSYQEYKEVYLMQENPIIIINSPREEKQEWSLIEDLLDGKIPSSFYGLKISLLACPRVFVFSNLPTSMESFDRKNSYKTYIAQAVSKDRIVQFKPAIKKADMKITTDFSIEDIDLLSTPDYIVKYKDIYPSVVQESSAIGKIRANNLSVQEAINNNNGEERQQYGNVYKASLIALYRKMLTYQEDPDWQVYTKPAVAFLRTIEPNHPFAIDITPDEEPKWMAMIKDKDVNLYNRIFNLRQQHIRNYSNISN